MVLPEIVRHFVSADNGRIWIDPKYYSVFLENNLLEFDNLMNFSEGEVYKTNKYRNVMRFQLGSCPAFFIKRHYSPRKLDSFYSYIKLKKPKSAGRLELEAIEYLTKAGIKTMVPIAFGELPIKLAERPSFLITEEIANAVRVEDYIAEKKEFLLENFKTRCNITEKLADISKKMHDSNIHHQDFYLGHILVSQNLDMWVIDVQRVLKKFYLRERWKIKDIAQMNYTAKEEFVTDTDRLRFYCLYKHTDELTQKDRKFIKSILKKNVKMKKHSIRKRRRKLKRLEKQKNL